MKKMLTNNLGLKLLSVLSAILLWVIVVSVDDPVRYQDFSNIRVTMLNEDAVTDKDKVYRIEDNSDVINVRVRAAASVLKDLSAEDFTATADMEKNMKFGNLVGIEVSCKNRKIKPSDITKSRENVVLSIEDASSEQFNVVVNQQGKAGTGYMVGSVIPEQNLIQISGPSSLIAKINRVEAVVKANGLTSDQVQICELQIRDNNDDVMDTTYLEYNGKTEGIRVNITILKTKTVPLKVEHSGTPADGYSFTGISYKPETLEIAGDESVIGGIREIVIPGEAVNLDGATENMQATVDVNQYLPAGVRLKNEADASLAVVVDIEKKQGKTVRIPVSEIGLRNVPKGLEADFGDFSELELIVMGTSADLQELKEDEIAVSLDLKKYTKAGTYTAAVEVTLPDKYTVMENVEVKFKLVKGSSAGSTETGGSHAGGTGGTGGGSAEPDGTGGSTGGTDTEEGGTTTTPTE